MRIRVRGLQSGGGATGTDEGQDVDAATLHDRRQRGTATARDDVDHARREDLTEELQGRVVAEHTETRQLHHDRVTHDQRRDHGGVALIERIVERRADHCHTVGTATDLSHHATHLSEGRRTVLHTLKFIDGILNVDDGTINLFRSIVGGLANLPHDQIHDLITTSAQCFQEAFHVADACGYVQTWPNTLALIESGTGGIERFERLLLGLHRETANHSLSLCSALLEDRRVGHTGLALPFSKLTVA
mmetsp:Transcript_32129/g.80658  ORF Transcript_32129/g.80658 Transcript_32129/m.80658 type:complete len:246 (-) Transcript_32129:168-905(-)